MKMQCRMLQACALFACVAVSGALYAATKPAADSARSREIERGRYLVAITGCNDCHTANFMLNGGKTPEKDRLLGTRLGWRGPWGTTYAANLRLYMKDMTEGQWLQVAREIQRRPPMPYYSLNAMKDADLRAIYRYIQFLGPAGEPAPRFVPADKEPAKPYVVMPASLD